jgi:hypothetical protein
MGKSLIIRKKRDGSVNIEGEAPDTQTFSARFLQRELGDLVDVRIILHTSDGDMEYQFQGYEPIEGAFEDEEKTIPRLNFTGLVCTKVEGS